MYQEKEFNVQDSSSVRGWECSCLAKTFHCSRKGSEKASQLPGTLQAAPRHWDPDTAFALCLKSVHPYFCILHTGCILHFHNSQSTNESSRADWMRKSKITISTDFSWTETLFIWGTDQQVGAASISDV